MGEVAEKRILLSALLDPPAPPKNICTAKKRRFRRCRSAPSVDFLTDQSEGRSLFPGSELMLGVLRPSFRRIAFFLVIYLGIGAVCFYLVKDQLSGKKTNGVLDAIYFCIVTMTTVGYGDLVPESYAAKLLACAFVFTGMAIVGMLLNQAADYLVEKQEVLMYRALHIRQKDCEASMLKKIESNRVKYKFYTSAVLLVLLMITGTIFLCEVEQLHPIDAFYCVCSTITTLGYGDKSFSTTGGRVFAVFWIIISTICLAQFFFYLAEVNAERRQKMLAKWVLNRRMTFVDLEAADLDDDGAVGAAEFIIYKLKEMGKITQEDISEVMAEFEDLDVDQSGTLSATDLVLGQANR